MNRPPIEEYINSNLGGQTEQIKNLKKYSEEMYDLQQQMISAAKNNTIVDTSVTDRLNELTNLFKQVTSSINDSKLRLADLAVDASSAFANIAQSVKGINVSEIRDDFLNLQEKMQEVSQMQFNLNNDNVTEYTNKLSEVINGMSTVRQFVDDLNNQGLNLNFDATGLISQLDETINKFTDVSSSASDFASRLTEVSASAESIREAFNKTSLAFESVNDSAKKVSSGADKTKTSLTELFAALNGNTSAQSSMTVMSNQIDELKNSIAALQKESADPQNLMGDAGKATALAGQISGQMMNIQQMFDNLMANSGDLSLKTTEELTKSLQLVMSNATDSISGTLSMIKAINEQLPQDIMNKWNDSIQASSTSSTDVLIAKMRADTNRITGNSMTSSTSPDMSYLSQGLVSSYANASGGIGASAAGAYQSSQMLLDMSSGMHFLNNSTFREIGQESQILARTGTEYKQAQSVFTKAISDYENASSPQEREKAKRAADEAARNLVTIQTKMNESAKKIGKKFKVFTPDDLARLGKEGQELTKFVNEVLTKASKSSGDLQALTKTLNLDVDEKALKSLIEDKKAMNEFGEEIQKTEKKANDLAKSLKDGVGGAMHSISSAIGSVKNVIGKLGLGLAALGPMAAAYKMYEFHIEQGRQRYKTMGVDAAIGVTDMATSAANAQQRLMQGNQVYAMSGGMIDRNFLNESYKSAMQSVGGHYGSSPEQAMGEVNELVGKTALMQQVYGIDQGTMNDMYQTYFKDMKMSASDAAGAIAQVTETARTAGIPVNKYLKMINSLAQNFMKIGIEGQMANTVMGNALARGMRADVAQEVTAEAGNALGKLAQDKNWVAYASSVSGMNPFEGIARAAYTHEADGSVRGDWVNDVVKMADIKVNTMAGAAGNDPNIKRMILTDTFKEMGFSQRSASTLTSSYLQGNTEQFKDLFEKESQKKDDPNAALEEVNKKLAAQLQAMTGQLAESDRLRAQLEAALYANADKVGHVVDDLLKQIGPLLLKLQSVMMTLGYLIVAGIGNLIKFISNYKPPEWLSNIVKAVTDFAANNPITAAAIAGVGTVATIAGAKYAKGKAVSGGKAVASSAAKYGKEIIKTGAKSKAGWIAVATLGGYAAYEYFSPGKAEMSPAVQQKNAQTNKQESPVQPQVQTSDGKKKDDESSVASALLWTSGVSATAALSYGAYSTYKNGVPASNTQIPNQSPKSSASSSTRSSRTNSQIKALRDASNKNAGLLRQQVHNLQLEARAASTKTSMATVKSEAAIQKSIKRNETKQQKLHSRTQSTLNANNKNLNTQAKAGREATQKASNTSVKNAKALSDQASKNAKSFFEGFKGINFNLGKLGTTLISGLGKLGMFLSKRILPAIGFVADGLIHTIKGDAVAGDYGASVVDNAIPAAAGLAGAAKGAALGATAGTAFFGIGAVPGAIIGGLIGGFGASWLADEAINQQEPVKNARESIKKMAGWDEDTLNEERIKKYGADYLKEIEENSLFGNTESDYYKRLVAESQSGNGAPAQEESTQEEPTKANISEAEESSKDSEPLIPKIVKGINEGGDKVLDELQEKEIYDKDQIAIARQLLHSDDMFQDPSKFGVNVKLDEYSPERIASGDASTNESSKTTDKAMSHEKADNSRKAAADSNAKKVVTQAQREEELSKVRNKSIVEFMKLEQELLGNFQASVSIEHGNLWKKSNEIEEVLKIINHNIIESGKVVESMGSGGGTGGGFAAGGNSNTLQLGAAAMEEFKKKNAEHAALAEKYAKQYGIDPRLYALLIKNESGFRSDARSEVGAYGYTQLMSDTAASLGVDRNTVAGQLEGGAKYLKQMMDTFGGDWAKAVAAYNAGPGGVKSAIEAGGENWHRKLYKETRNYIKKFGLATGDATGNGEDFKLVAPDAQVSGGGTPSGQVRWQSQFENGGDSTWCTAASYGMLYNSLHGTNYDVNYIHDNIWNGNTHGVDNILNELGLQGTVYTGSVQRAREGLKASLNKGTPTYLYFHKDKYSKLNSGRGSHAVIIQSDGKGGFTYYNPAAKAESEGIGHISFEELSNAIGSSSTSVLVPDQFNGKYKGSGVIPTVGGGFGGGQPQVRGNYLSADGVSGQYQNASPYSITQNGIGNAEIETAKKAQEAADKANAAAEEAIKIATGQTKAKEGDKSLVIDTTKSQEEQIKQATGLKGGSGKNFEEDDIRKLVESGKSVPAALEELVKSDKYKATPQITADGSGGYVNNVTAGISAQDWGKLKVMHLGQIYNDYSSDVRRGLGGSSEGIDGIMDAAYGAPVSSHTNAWQQAMIKSRSVVTSSGLHRSARQRLKLDDAKDVYRMAAEETGETWRLKRKQDPNSLVAKVEKAEKEKEEEKDKAKAARDEKVAATADAIKKDEKTQELANEAIEASKDKDKLSTEEMQKQAEKDLENKKIDIDVIINDQLDNFIEEFEKKITPFIEGLGANVKKLDKHVQESAAASSKDAAAIFGVFEKLGKK